MPAHDAVLPDEKAPLLPLRPEPLPKLEIQVKPYPDPGRK
jgi:hypothetical protein